MKDINSKATQSELQKLWKEYAAMQSDFSDNDDPYKVGDAIITTDDKKYKIKERCGKNKSGVYEYYVEPVAPMDRSGYITEREILIKHNEELKFDEKCEHKNRYENTMPVSGDKFWVCPDCKEEVPPPIPGRKILTQEEIDELFEGEF